MVGFRLGMNACVDGRIGRCVDGCMGVWTSGRTDVSGWVWDERVGG